jgi:hypothetical protein
MCFFRAAQAEAARSSNSSLTAKSWTRSSRDIERLPNWAALSA